MAAPEIGHIAQARSQTLFDVLLRSASRYPHKLAVADGDERWSYQKLVARAEDLAAGLADIGIGKGERVAVLSRNSLQFVALRFAVARAGAIFVPINFMLNVDDVAYILEHSGAAALFVDESCATVGLNAAGKVGVRHKFALASLSADTDAANVQTLGQLLGTGGTPPSLHELDGAATAQIIYTSGTEARPKGAMLTHEAIIWQYQSCIADCGWDAHARVLHALPLFHCAQLDTFLGPSLAVGGSNWIISAPDPTHILSMVSQQGINSFFAPPTVWIALLRSPQFDRHDLDSLSHGYYGASIMPVEILRELRERLPAMRLWNCYGQTEIAPIAIVLQPEDQERKAGAAGRPVLNVLTRVVDDAMDDVPPGDVGEIVHRSPQLMKGYWNDPEKTAEAFEGGWFHSGDLGVIDDEGYITIVDRKKDMIKSGGENVASREVEEVLYRHPAIAEVAVIGLPDSKWIEAVTAVVVLRDGMSASAADIYHHCHANLSAFKVPKRIVFSDALPRNASGKILKRDLRMHLLE
ncbi:MAG: acyl-CoA synthetase [Novosphingobium sp. SCN 66-18]|nr:MAG: acyl-CoA synthetase [Novosphingobium sp. SCN 66-18]